MKNFIQHVVYSHREGLRWYFKSTERKGEDNEVEEVKWIDIRKLNNYKWAFNHNKIIERIILLKQYIQNDRHKHFS